MNATLSLVLAGHSELDALFEKHQRAILCRDLAGAAAILRTFATALGRHIAFEDEVLLPLYASKGAEVEGGTLPIFHAEHRKLREMTGRLVLETEAADTSPDLLGAILRLLDDEALFKGLFAHHAMREENLLFPRLEACTTEAEKQKVAANYAHFAN